MPARKKPAANGKVANAIAEELGTHPVGIGVGTAAGLAVALVLQSGLLAYAMYVLLGVLIVTRVITRNGINNVTAERSCEPTEVDVGAQVHVSLTVRNEGSLPVPWVLFEDVL